MILGFVNQKILINPPTTTSVLEKRPSRTPEQRDPEVEEVQNG